MSRHLITATVAAALFACAPESTTNDITVDPERSDMGIVRAETALEPVRVTIANTGTQPTSVTELSVDPSFEPWFAVQSEDLPIVLQPGEVTLVDVVLTELPLDVELDGTYFMTLDVQAEGEGIAAGCGSDLPQVDVESAVITFTLAQRCEVDEDGDGIGPNAPFTAWCDQTLDGGGWMLLAWATSQTSFANQRVWANYQSSSPTVVPSTRGFSNRMSTLPATFGGATLDVRQTYRQSVDQSTLDITTGTTRVITLDSTWNGALTTTNPLPAGQARHTVGHNCSGFTYIDASGVSSTLDDKGCYVEYTNYHSGSWAACGENAYSSGGAAFNLCFDNAVTTNNRGNSALGLWHSGSMGYHEVYEHNFNGSTAANGTWNSTGGDWTWSAWVRTQ